MNISVIGTGYVGLVTGTCFAETGNDVTCLDTDAAKIERLKRGEIPFYEPGLAELVERNMQEGRLKFSTQVEDSISQAEISFICVGTPSQKDGAADLQFVMTAAETVAKAAKANSIITIKSTVPVGTSDKVKSLVAAKGRKDLRVVSNPEFLREGTAVQDCLLPDRIVIGTDNHEVADVFRELYHPFVRTGQPILVFDPRSAEMTKYAANALLALRISFMNEIAMLCERVNADVTRVRAGIGSDQRIGMQYLFPSVGFGGSCFPKDVRALAFLTKEAGLPPRLLQATLDVNDAQKEGFAKRIYDHFGGKSGIKGKAIAFWGLAFKAKTDDVRESPALTVLDRLVESGAKVTVYDPVATANVKAIYGDKVLYGKSAYQALEGAEALCVLTEWNQFRHPDFPKILKTLKKPVIFDGRNLYDPDALKAMGFAYYSIGRPSSAA